MEENVEVLKSLQEKGESLVNVLNEFCDKNISNGVYKVVSDKDLLSMAEVLHSYMRTIDNIHKFLERQSKALIEFFTEEFKRRELEIKKEKKYGYTV
ncbi:MAG: hypothetical protein LBQ13_04300 [Endomicrobium sp.]|jgi:hypothetical protein|nr:hypothetical protein [Endomicrobium sp.]